MTTHWDKAERKLEIGAAVRKERNRCTTIALSFTSDRDARSEAEKEIARRIAEVIQQGPIP